jgi:hypothetical protein
VPGTPRPPKGPPLENLWLRDRPAARRFLRHVWEDDQIRDLIDAGRRGLHAAHTIRLLVPYNRFLSGARGIGKLPTPRGDLERPGLDAPTQVVTSLDRLAEDAVGFVRAYATLRRHADRLRRGLAADPFLTQRRSGLRQPMQMFCAYVMLAAEGMGLPEPTSGQLAALALLLDVPELPNEQATSARAMILREKAWDHTKRKVKHRVLGAIRALERVSLDGS